MDLLWALLGVLAVVHAGYALWTAKRLDRLHRRVDVAAAALDAQLRQRAQAAVAAGRPGSALAAAARAALDCHGLGREREDAENALSRGIDDLHRSPDRPDATDAVEALAAAATRANYARAFYNDAVRDALVGRRRRIVRAFRLAGSARMPAFFEMDEAVPGRRTIGV